MTRTQRFRRSLVVAGCLPLAVAAPYALAAWLSHGTGLSTAAATTLTPVGSAPTVSTVGTAARVSWSATTLANGVAVEGYRVVRHVGATTSQACTSTSLTCDDLTPSSSTAQYGVVAYRGTWTSAESPLSVAGVYGDGTAPSTSITRIWEPWNEPATASSTAPRQYE